MNSRNAVSKIQECQINFVYLQIEMLNVLNANRLNFLKIRRKALRANGKRKCVLNIKSENLEQLDFAFSFLTNKRNH